MALTCGWPSLMGCCDVFWLPLNNSCQSSQWITWNSWSQKVLQEHLVQLAQIELRKETPRKKRHGRSKPRVETLSASPDFLTPDSGMALDTDQAPNSWPSAMTTGLGADWQHRGPHPASSSAVQRGGVPGSSSMTNRAHQGHRLKVSPSQ